MILAEDLILRTTRMIQVVDELMVRVQRQIRDKKTHGK